MPTEGAPHWLGSVSEPIESVNLTCRLLIGCETPRTAEARRRNVVEEQSSDIPPAPSFDDLLDFLNAKAADYACSVCKSKEFELARERKVAGKRFRPSITLVGPKGPFQEYAFYTSCSNCGAIQMFDLRPFKRWKGKSGGERNSQS